ncbi:MAG: NAD(P)H-dependent oxidoreductase subunit E [Anaerolineales bacterium]|nr:NAD(P)H-dependent oxidoreductase subunit E [Anaerolineales bacterium]
MNVETSMVDKIIEKHGLEQGALIPTLLDIQDQYHYLPIEALQRVAEQMTIPMLKVHQVAEFYNALSLEERGKHIITVCMGTACHVQGSGQLIDHVGHQLRYSTRRNYPR